MAIWTLRSISYMSIQYHQTKVFCLTSTRHPTVGYLYKIRSMHVKCSNRRPISMRAEEQKKNGKAERDRTQRAPLLTQIYIIL